MENISRRAFLKSTGLSSTAFIVGLQLPAKGALAKTSRSLYSNHYFLVGPNQNEFVFTMDKAEMGQGVITGQLTMFCEEADIDPALVKVVTAPVDSVYGTMSEMQITGGSSSTRDRWELLRQTGANVRGVFLKAASQHLSEPIEGLKAENGFVFSKSGKKISYNELSKIAAGLKMEKAPLKKPDEFKYIGKITSKFDAEEKSMGTASFGIDFNMEGLLTASILRPPFLMGKIESFDKSEAQKVSGIKYIGETSSGIAVVGEKYWQVLKAKNLIKVKWKNTTEEGWDSEKILTEYDKLLDSPNGKIVLSKGEELDSYKALQDESIIEAEYQLPYLAHATMEPMNAAAHVTKARVDIWVPSQGPTLIRNFAADYLNRPRDQVFVHTTKYLGGGFGRRSTMDYPIEAVELSARLNKPVKVIWSREDDIKHSPMRPISKHKMKAVLKNKKPSYLEHRIACESIMQLRMPGWIPLMIPGWVPEFFRNGIGKTSKSIMSWLDVNMTTAEGAKEVYQIPNQEVRINNLGLEVPIHFWRSVGHSFNGFVVESFVDELAHAAQTDPLDFRVSLLDHQPRGENVLKVLKEFSSWEKELPKNRARGVAYTHSFKSYVAQVAEVEIESNQILVKKVYCVVDCGIAINPKIIEDQMISSIIYGLSAALHGQIDLERGSIKQSNFDDYPMVRITGAPEVMVKIIQSDKPPTGVGEPGLPPIAPAVANALFKLTGKRLRSLPLKL